METLSSLNISHPYIALIGSGRSVLDLSDEDVELLRRHAFVVTLNYAPIRLQGHLNIWSDRKVSDFLEQHFASRSKNCLLSAQEGRVGEKLKGKIDFWFSRKKDNLKGNFTLVWALQLLRRHFPDKPILLFGVDMYADNPEVAKWYDKFTDYDRHKRGKRYNTALKLEDCGRQIKQYIPRIGIFNCNLRSRLEHFPKRDWREVLGFRVLHLCPTALAGAPVHLSRILNKYTLCTSQTMLRSNFKARELKNLRWDFDIVGPTRSRLREAIESADLIQYHRTVYPGGIEDKPSVILFHSPQPNYKPGKTLEWLNGRKMAVAQYQPLIYSDARVVPNLIDIWAPQHQPAEKAADRVKIFYSWASEKKGGWRDKGSERTLDILRRIQAAYGKRVEVKVLKNVPYRECLAEKQTAHICIDECVTGSYHLQSLEGCSVGALTINNLSPAIHGFIQQVTGQKTHPFKQTDLEGLFDVLSHYIENPGELEQKGKLAREWMERHWDPKVLVQPYLHGYVHAIRHGKLIPENCETESRPETERIPDERRHRSVERKARIIRKRGSPGPEVAEKTREKFPEWQPACGRSYRELHQRYAGEDIYILGTGPSLFQVDPGDFSDKICLGINYAFEVIPDPDFIFAHVIETCETLQTVVPPEKLVLPDTLVRQHYRDARKNILPQRIPTRVEGAWIYPLQEPGEKNIHHKSLSLDQDAEIFCWSTTTHSAIHMAAYMGARNIVLVGVDYALYPGGKVHFISKHSPIYGMQDWNALTKHRQGDEWLARQLRRHGIRLSHYPVKERKVRAKTPAVVDGSTGRRNGTASQGKPIRELFRRYQGEDIYIFGSGPSLFQADPEEFRDKVCLGINYSFEVMPHMDYILVHEIETYESLVGVVDNSKFLLPEYLFRHTFADGRKPAGPPTIRTRNPQAYIYPIQDPSKKRLEEKALSLDVEARIFTWSTTTHSAIHLAAYMGAKRIFLIGVDYRLYPDGRVHFDARNSAMYGTQRWNVNPKHRQGDLWLAEQLNLKGISLENISHSLVSSKRSLRPIQPPVPKPEQPLRVRKIRVNRSQYYMLDHWIWKQYQNLDWEPRTYRVFQQFLRPESIYIDLGAWIGLTLLYAREIGVKQLFAVEANPETFAMLRENCRLNQLPADVQNLCLYAKEGPVPFGNPVKGPRMSSAASIQGRGEWMVEGITLSQYLNRHVPQEWDFMKIDIEGAETHLFDDLEKIAGQPGKVIYLSLHPPFWKNREASLKKLQTAAEAFGMRDSDLSPLSGKELGRRVLSRQANPPWGTEYGNFFEIVLESGKE